MGVDASGYWLSQACDIWRWKNGYGTVAELNFPCKMLVAWFEEMMVPSESTEWTVPNNNNTEVKPELCEPFTEGPRGGAYIYASASSSSGLCRVSMTACMPSFSRATTKDPFVEPRYLVRMNPTITAKRVNSPFVWFWRWCLVIPSECR